MFNVRIIQGKNQIITSADAGTKLSDILNKENSDVAHPCGGAGRCGKCTVKVNGKDELSCRYIINSDITVEIPTENSTQSPSVGITSVKHADGQFIAIDIGTTTLAFALCNKDGSVINSLTTDNPQRKYGADVMSRISYCSENGTAELCDVLIEKINTVSQAMLDREKIDRTDTVYVTGNTTMLHLFLGVDCSSIGISPYTPTFVEGKKLDADKHKISFADNIETLPCISAFVGADITAGLGFVGMPSEGKYNILLDLGTNAEMVLYSSDRILCTSAAAGPCFEGVEIECGMSASKGAISRYNRDGTCSVIGDVDAEGICATGLTDIISVLLDRKIITKDGTMVCDRFEITEDVYITREDVRKYQLAKSAVCSALSVLMQKADISYSDVETFYVAGGFSAGLDTVNASNVGLFPKELKDKFTAVNNSSLKGTIRYAAENTDLTQFTDKAEYVDMSSDKNFSELFIKNMMF